jgi:hypothetical protein
MNTLLITCFFALNLYLSPFALAETEDDNLISKAENNSRQSTIKLETEAQRLSGIETIKLKPATFQSEFTAQGKALSLQPLLALRSRNMLSITERSSAEARYKQAEQSINRQQDLYRNGISSKRNLQEQQAQWQSSKALLNATHFQNKAIIDETHLIWGKELTNWALSENTEQLNGFLTNQQKLLLISLPTGKHLTDSIKTIYVEITGDRSKAQKAELISTVTQTDTIAQGENYYFKTNDKKIISGLHVTAWIPEKETQTTGVIIPKSALIWYMDQAVVYVKTTDKNFSRVNITNYSNAIDGYFVTDAIKPDDQIVIKGAQTLLSEELKGQIPSENDD